ncbi:peptidoglycan-binding domain-containing protein [Streptomyces sp. ITFR-6]|uniref:peptidoglycan-binding domain-containing protein n=1 Tax=Streptomyces sp. ITFR-6 TaxID=3075197 RepID=UPI00288A3DE7|nr:peptidoglycan-binding domain-containing protein [Streptomyces sp. ITFR-6]WNI32144.1 peptidoglycan-binding domain-containing protein [Streptomyces sp. ITFR-6]
MTGHICPECGTDSRPGTGPGCGCAPRGGARQPWGGGQRHVTREQRAAEQHRVVQEHHAGRSAEFAAAEDFDPLRIRPYVTLGGEETVGAEETTAGPDGSTAYPAEGSTGYPAEGSTGYPAEGHAGDAATTMPLFLDPAGPGPLHTPGSPDDHPGTPAPTADPVRPRRRSPFAALAAGAAVAAVMGTAAFVGGLFNGDGNGDADLDPVLPSTVTSLPEESAAPSPSTTASASASPSRSAPASPSASTGASASASASGSGSPSASTSASASASTGPSAPATASSPVSTGDPAGTDGTEPAAPPALSAEGGTLRRGDHGPEVAELQRRLQEIGLFMSTADADYTDRVEDAVHRYQRYMYIQGDDDGVYGPNTRRALEAITTGHGRY